MLIYLIAIAPQLSVAFAVIALLGGVAGAITVIAGDAKEDKSLCKLGTRLAVLSVVLAVLSALLPSADNLRSAEKYLECGVHCEAEK